MRGGHWLGAVLAVLAALVLVAPAPAQFICPPFPGPPAIVFGNGFAVQYPGRRLGISGYIGDRGVVVYGPGAPALPAFPYGPVSSRVTIQYIVPSSSLASAPPARLFGAGRLADGDIAGVDLDLIPSKKPVEAVKPAPPPLPGVDVSVPKPPVRPDDVPEAKKPEPPQPEPPAKPLPPPKDNPKDEATRLLDLGLTAFSQQHYGLAAFRFRQATEANAGLVRAHFLAAQAALALGKYKDAVAAIEEGMRRRPDWPNADFNPRKELYKGAEPDFMEHLDRLHETVKKSPENPTYLFLYAYALWFDGRRAEAVPLFQRARDKAADKTYIDAFLKAAPPGVLAVR